MEEGKITRALLKTRSGEFDLESIHSLNLMELGLIDLGCISECTCLLHLNLSRNDITRLTKLAGLTELNTLNLSGNRIMSLEGLQSLDNLQTINLSGNLIGGVESLHCLTGLVKLQNLTLNDRPKSLSNPMCVNNYREDIKKMFPNLQTLDGERVHGRGSEVFNMFHDIEEALNSRKRSLEVNNIPKAVEFVPQEFWTLNDHFKKSNLNDAEDQLKALLTSCSDLDQRAGITLEAFEKSFEEKNGTEQTFLTSENPDQT